MTYENAVFRIIKEQSQIIGPLAIEIANSVDGLQVINIDSKEIHFQKDSKQIIHDLIQSYAQFFGKTSIEICKDIIRITCPEVPEEDMSIMTANVME
jgi:hypothetical protein